MTFPLGQYEFYVGVDPGNKGALGLMNKAGTMVQSSTMPMADGEPDLAQMRSIFKYLARLPQVAVCIEWPQAFPQSFGNVPAHAVKFGRHLGMLESFAYLHVGPENYFKVPPNLWKGRLGLDGKTIEGANERAAALWGTFYPDHSDIIHGPRGGILDGVLDALLIAHLARTRSPDGMKSIVDTFGKDSAQAFAFIMGGGRRKRKFGKRIGPDSIRGA